MSFYELLLVISLSIIGVLFFLTRRVIFHKIVVMYCKIVLCDAIVESLICWVIKDLKSAQDMVFWEYIWHIILQIFTITIPYRLFKYTNLLKNKFFSIFLLYLCLLTCSFIFDLLTGCNIFFFPERNTYSYSLYYTILFIPPHLIIRYIIIIVTLTRLPKISDCPKKILGYCIVGITCVFFVSSVQYIYFFIYLPVSGNIVIKPNYLVMQVGVFGVLISVVINLLLMLSYLEILINKNKTIKYSQSSISDDKVDSIVKHMDDLMKNSALYRDSELRIDDVAGKLNVPKVYISQILNENLGINFYEYINQYRIDEALQLINNNNSPHILDLAFQVGFNSVSTFYKYFKKYTGDTPKNIISKRSY